MSQNQASTGKRLCYICKIIITITTVIIDVIIFIIIVLFTKFKANVSKSSLNWQTSVLHLQISRRQLEPSEIALNGTHIDHNDDASMMLMMMLVETWMWNRCCSQQGNQTHRRPMTSNIHHHCHNCNLRGIRHRKYRSKYSISGNLKDTTDAKGASTRPTRSSSEKFS